MGAVGAGRIALTLAAVAAVGVLGLILLSVLGDPFGTSMTSEMPLSAC